MDHLSFQKPDVRADFYTLLQKRVNQYFLTNKISPYCNARMVLKTVLIVAVFLSSYLLLLSNWIASPAILLFLAMLHGFAVALIGLNIAHDALHDAYTSSQAKNRVLGLCFNLIGANDFMWRCSHNIMHHTNTNIAGHDADIEQIPLLRFHPHQARWGIHRFQHIYVFFFYGFTTIVWVFVRDYVEFFHPKVRGVDKTTNPVYEFLRLVFFKCLYYTLFIVIPLIVMDISWQYFIVGFVAMHFTKGMTLSLIFQLAHIVENSRFPLPEEGVIKQSWAAHQMYTTANFGCDNNLLNYICGGLNFQIEHHLFPKVCHIHYKHIAPIVKKTSLEFKLPYNSYPTYMSALHSHIKELKHLGTT